MHLTNAYKEIRKQDHTLQVIGDMYQSTSESSTCFYKIASLKSG